MPKRYNGGRLADPLVMRAVELLEDGEWHYVEDVLRELMKMVPPGRALRQAEQQRQYDGPAQRVRHKSERQLIEIGRRLLARRALVGSGKADYFEMTPASPGPKKDETRLIRLIGIPPAVQHTRELKAAGQIIDDELIDEIVASHDPVALLAERFPKRAVMEKIVVKMIERIQELQER